MNWTRRHWSRAALGSALFVSGPRSAVGATPGGTTLSLELDPRPVSAHEVTYLQAKLTLTQRPNELSEVEVTAPPGVRVRQGHRSQSQVTRIINGKVSREISLDYTFEISCRRPGQYSLGARVRVDGRWVVARTRVRLVVQKGGAKPTSGKAGDPVMIVPHFSPEGPIYVGQLALYQLELWTLRADVPSSVERPKFEQFITEDFPPPGRRIVNMRGQSYSVQSIYYRALFPQKAGEFEISGIELEMTPSGLGSLFGGARRRRPYRIAGPATKVKVLELPQKGRPANFQDSHVGRFRIRSEVDRSDLKAKDAFTLIVEIKGRGNLRLVDPGKLPKIPGIRSYEPKRDEPEYRVRGERVQGSVRWSYLLIAEKPGTVTLPALELHYFDPEAKRYKSTKTSPITLDIKDATGNVPQGAAQASPDSTEAPAEDPDKDEVVDRAESMEFAALRTHGAVDDRQAAPSQWLSLGRYAGLVALAPASVAGLVAKRWLSTRLGQPERIRRRQQKAELEALLHKAKGAKQGSDKEAWASLGQLLQRLAMMRTGSSAQGLPRPQLLDAMQRAGVSSQDTAQWGIWLDRCDASRFGAGDEDPKALQDAVAFAQSQIEAWEQRPA